jgi:uncharacterized damage-inducible protein DinB
MGQKMPATYSTAGADTRSEKSRFLSAYEAEHATTRKILGAFPAAQADFRPHERSNTALMLAYTFVVEELFLIRALKHESVVGGGFGGGPGTWESVLAAFDRQHEEVLAMLRDPSNPNLEGSVSFFTGPKQMGNYSLSSFLWFMLHDQIHHRGQLSVYVRMTGGKLPSIYGPTADEPWS